MDFRLLFVLVLGLLINTGENTDSQITCSVPSVELGEATNLTCYFKNNIMEAKQDFLIQHYPQNGHFRDILTCFLETSGKLDCQGPKSGYENYELDNDTVTVRISSATMQHVGRYRCQVIPSEPKDIVPCNFTLKESSTNSSTLEETPSPRTTDDEGNITMFVIPGLVVVFVLVVVIVVIICWKRRKRRSNTEAVEHLPREFEPMNDTVESPTDSKECAETQVLISETKPNHSVDDSTEQDTKVTLGNDRAYFLREAPGEGGEVAEQSAPHPEEDRRHSQIPDSALPRAEEKESTKTEKTTSPSPATLFAACEGGDVEAVKSLLDRGANVNATDKKNRTPLHVACTSGGKTMVEVLLEKGASTEVQDDEGNTPLHLACHRGSREIVQLLLDKQAKRFTKNNANLTPSDLAESAGHTDIETLFHVVTDTKVPGQRPRKPKKVRVE
ncbi:hypothetical protein BaRGS_00035340 [Batillaria attramentaria]|uniref:Uncharacterized protein n=1 Tax=Batillaria attramentaria TaxID=370345 RepID=A0ABD0JF10_9CAEN